MTFVRTIPVDAAEGSARELYDQVKTEFGFIPNWAHASSLRPGVRRGWTTLIGSIRENLSVILRCASR